MTWKPINLIDLPWRPLGKVIDPYAGSHKWWKGLDTTNVTFVDSVVPDGNVLASITALPFEDGEFDWVAADPPHWIRKSAFSEGHQKRFGWFGVYKTRDDLRREWADGTDELWRVTKPRARMIWKSIDKAKTKSQCACFDDLGVIGKWTLIDELRVPSRVTWSSAETLFTLWERKDR